MIEKSGVILSFLFLLGLSLIPGCSWIPAINEYLIKFDSIEYPTRIKANTEFIIEFYGTVGTNGCSGFSHFDVAQIGNEINIEAWKVVHDGPVICPAVMVYLEGESLHYTISTPGEYRIIIRQPDETSLVEIIMVE